MRSLLFVCILAAATAAVVAVQDKFNYTAVYGDLHNRMISIRDKLIPTSMFKEAMFHLLTYYAPLDAQTELCRNHSQLYLEAFLEDSAWAAQMFDASSKIGDGLSKGNFIGLGSYEACLSVNVPGKFKGQHCLIETSGIIGDLFETPPASEYTLFPSFNLDFAFSLCVPSTCTAQDVLTHINVALADINATGIVTERSCSVREPKQLRLSDWAAMYIVVAFVAVIVLSTSYDYYVCHQPSKKTRILTAFSLQANTKKLLTINSSSSVLSVLYFLRFFAIVWILAGHRFDLILSVPQLDLTVTRKYLTVWWMAPLLDVNIAVEIFFLVSGLLVALNFLKARQSGQQFSLFQYYVHRYIRLTPSLALIVLMEATLMYQASEGPIWKRLVGDCMDKCTTNWWSSLLYISNYLHPYYSCMLQSWYLCVDMQLYILSPLLLFPLYKNPNTGLKLIAACLAATILASFWNAMYLGLHAGSNVSIKKQTERNHGAEYVKTHLRAASWLMGLILGYLIFEFKHKGRTLVIGKVTVVLAWLASTCLWLAVVFSVIIFQNESYQYNQIIDSLYLALSRPLFSLGFAWLIFACVTGYGGPINAILSWTVFQPLGTLSYGIYLTHLTLQVMDMGRIYLPYQYDAYILFSKWLSDIVQSMICAYILYVVVEGPCAEIDRWIFSKPRVVKQENGNTTALQLEHSNNTNSSDKSKL